MIKILDETKKDLIAIKVTGELIEKDYDILNPIMEKTLKDYDNPKLYCEIHELDMPTTKAVWEDLKNIPDYNKFEKCAFVSSKDWINSIAKLADTIMKPEVKHYEFREKAVALKWLK